MKEGGKEVGEKRRGKRGEKEGRLEGSRRKEGSQKRKGGDSIQHPWKQSLRAKFLKRLIVIVNNC